MGYSVLEPTQRVYDALSARLVARRPDMPKIERSYIAIGDIDFPTRCSQFAVAARQVYAGAPSAQSAGPIVPHAGYTKRSLELGVAYTDCWPLADGLIKPEKENEAATKILSAVDIVVEETIKAYYAGELVDDCADASLGPFTMVGPSGGVAGVTVLVTVQFQ